MSLHVLHQLCGLQACYIVEVIILVQDIGNKGSEAIGCFSKYRDSNMQVTESIAKYYRLSIHRGYTYMMR